MPGPTYRCLVAGENGYFKSTHHVQTYEKLKDGTNITYSDGSVFTVQRCDGLKQPGQK